MSVVNLYSQLSNATPGGVWTLESNTGPLAPTTYNGTVNFLGFLAGDYIYKYTVTVGTLVDTSLVTITWNGSAPNRVNDTCDNALFISDLTVAGDIITSDNNTSECPYYKSPNKPDPLDYPTIWNQGEYTGDLWYYFKADMRNSLYNMTIQVDSENYLGIASGFGIQVYTSTTLNCSAKTLVGSKAVALNSTTLNYSVPIAPGTSPYIIFRVVSVVPGDFDITVAKPENIDGVIDNLRLVKNYYDENGTGIIVWNIISDGAISSDILNGFEVYANGKRLEYPAEYTVTRYSTAYEHTIQILNPLPMTYYTLIANP